MPGTPFATPPSPTNIDLYTRLQNIRNDTDRANALLNLAPFLQLQQAPPPAAVAAMQGHLPQGHLPAAPSFPQQQFIQQQIRDASQYMSNHFGINVEQTAWRPPWAYQPELSPDPAYTGRSNFMPAFVAHPTCSQTAGPPAPPRMDVEGPSCISRTSSVLRYMFMHLNFVSLNMHTNLLVKFE